MPLFYVYKEDWSHYIENRGVIVKTTDWKRAKGIAMAQPSWKGQSRSNILVDEINPIQEGIVCVTDYIANNTTCN